MAKMRCEVMAVQSAADTSAYTVGLLFEKDLIFLLGQPNFEKWLSGTVANFISFLYDFQDYQVQNFEVGSDVYSSRSSSDEETFFQDSAFGISPV